MKIYIFLMLMCLGLFAQAQYVSIPDSNFRKKLYLLHPNCFNGSQQMDTTCFDVVHETTLYVNQSNIENLEGVQYFDSLKSLFCYNNHIISFPSLPNSLRGLSCSNNQLVFLPSLPIGLQSLNCNNNLMTTLPSLPNGLQFLDCSNNLLISLPILPDSLLSLDCNNNQLLTLPNMPSSLQYLTCYDNQLISLPNLPNNLQVLECYRNQLNSLPSLPINLRELYCGDNQIIIMPNLPGSLQILECFRNQISQLPSLPNSLQKLDFYANNIVNLPNLPSSLIYLECGYNKLRSLPNLPNNLQSLNCIYNQLNSLPSLPNSLQSLNLWNNLLTQISSLPNSIEFLNCDDNYISKFPNLPNSLKTFSCNNNPLLSCLPILPQSITYLRVQNTSITCLPNKPAGIVNHPLPICPNGSSCEPKPTASGIVFHDINANGIYEIGVDSVLTGCVITNSNGWSASSMQNGEYQMKLDSGVVNSVSLSPFTPYAQSTPINYQITPNSSGSQGSNYNFAVTFIPNVQDLRVDVTAGPARPGFNQWCSTTIHNIGTLNVSNATLKVLKPTTFNFLNAYPPISQQIGDTLIWNNINISVLQQMGFYFNLNVPTNATLGTPYQIQAWVFPTLNDSTPSNNQTVYQDSIIGSFDPNDKAVNITQLDPDNLGQELKYTIRFQNTGTDTAFTVIIRDTLSNHLDMSTFKIVGASHPYSFIVRDHGLLEVFFQNILLPDSFTNEPKSHGFVQYAVKPKSTLQIGDQILNTASIYFDFNLPVVTNTVVTEMKVTSIFNSNNLESNIYPNPSTGKIRIELASNELTSLTICDLTGKILIEKSVSNGSEIDLQQLTKGLYLAKLENKSGVKVVKLVRE